MARRFQQYSMLNRPHHIGHFLASNFLGGPEKQLIEHARRIAERNVKPCILSFVQENDSNQLLDAAQRLNIPTKAVYSSGPFDPRVIGDVLNYIRSEKIELLCVHGYKANVIGRIASWRAGIPLVAISRGWTGEDRKVSFYEWLDRIFLRFADHIVAVSDKQKQKIMRIGIRSEVISVIHNCINVADKLKTIDSLRSEFKFKDEAIIVASAGRLSPEKNFSGLIDAAKIVVDRNINIIFIIFGEGVLRKELEEKIRSAGLADNFILPGFRSDIQTLLKDIDIFVLPSFTEGLPNVVLEAFAASKPVIATAVGGTPEVVEDGVSGFLVEPQQLEKMAEYILLLANNSKLRKAMGHQGFACAKKRFSFEHQTDQYEQLYCRIIDKKNLRSLERDV